MSALVKVIVPCYRYGEVLEGCVESVLGQAGVDVRVLVIDDCSPDDTPTVASRLAQAEERVEYRRHERNVGLIGTANEGLDWAGDGDYVVLLSADDMLVPGSLLRAVSVMESHPGVGMVYGHAQYFQAGRPLPRFSRNWRGTRTWSGVEWIRLRCRSGYNCISSPEVVVRASVQREAGYYDPACPHASDLNMWLRVAAISDIAYVKGAVQALYQVHPDSMYRSMVGGDSGAMADLVERRASFAAFFAGAGVSLAGADRLRSMVGRALARQALWQASRAYDRAEVGVVPVGELIAFALGTCPDARRLREWWGLKLRQRIGAGRSLWFLPFIASGAGHRLRGHVSSLRWRARGV